TIFLGAAVGLLAAWILAELLKRHLVPEFLRSFLVLSAVVAQFVVSNELREESGLVAVTVCGMVLTNWRGVRTEDILHFKENLSVILISGLFIVLAARLQMEQIAALGSAALLMLCVVQFVARPLSVIISTAGSSLNWREKALLSWVAPRGIVAAAISALFAERLTIFLGAAVGLLAAWILAELLKRHLVPEFLRSFLVLSAVVAQFVVSNELREESGLVAVTVCGMVLTNWRGVRTEDILHFKENLSVILISGLFIVLAARLQMEQIAALGSAALLMLCVVQFVARPLSVIISTAGSSLNWREKALLSWVAPRGIVAAAISALFAERL
ncbi:K(+)/H(+) antiporter NhaP2 (Potassium/proton antiporter NhaP2), partial [Durusdinium trenchii]